MPKHHRPPQAKPKIEVEVEPGADKRLIGILKKVLHTPPKHVPDKRTRANKRATAPGTE